jgi:hypothetical protein
VGRGTCDLSQLIASFLSNPHAGLAALGDESSKPVIGALASHHHLVKTSASGSQRLFDRMDAIEDFHEQ